MCFVPGVFSLGVNLLKYLKLKLASVKWICRAFPIQLLGLKTPDGSKVLQNWDTLILKKKNISSLKLTLFMEMNGWKMSFLLGYLPFLTGHVSFRECILFLKNCHIPVMKVERHHLLLYGTKGVSMTSDFWVTSVCFFWLWVGVYQIQQDVLLEFYISAATCFGFFLTATTWTAWDQLEWKFAADGWVHWCSLNKLTLLQIYWYHWVEEILSPVDMESFLVCLNGFHIYPSKNQHDNEETTIEDASPIKNGDFHYCNMLVFSGGVYCNYLNWLDRFSEVSAWWSPYLPSWTIQVDDLFRCLPVVTCGNQWQLSKDYGFTKYMWKIDRPHYTVYIRTHIQRNGDKYGKGHGRNRNRHIISSLSIGGFP